MDAVDAQLSVRDPARLAALRRLAILDTSPEESFDRLTRLAARTLGVPVSLVTLVDESRQFFKSCAGLPEALAGIRETPLSHSFCQYVVAGADPLVVHDAREEPALRDNAAVTQLGVVAYLGAPLMTEEGFVLGSFCVIDHEPRVWTREEIETVQELAATTTTLVELAAANGQARQILESIGDAFLALDEGANVVYLNPAGERLLGRSAEELVGRNAWHEFPEVVGTPFESETRRAMREGEPVEYEAHYAAADLWFSVRVYPSRGGVAVYFRNVTWRKRLEEELETSREEAIYRLARAIALRSRETGAHVERIARYCGVLARRLGLGERESELVRIASQLHDVGKISIPDEVLLAPRPLSRQERAVMHGHTVLGHGMLTGSGQELLELAATVALTHHERPDGRGYPHGLSADAIPLPSRIVAVADVFDALTSERAYRAPLSADQALDLMRRERGTQFDPDVLDCFLAATGEMLAIRTAYVDEPEA